MTDYLHTKFGLIWMKETKVTEGGADSAPPQVDNVLNRQGEIGLRKKNAKLNPERLFSLFQTNGV